jgi:hypothetical protein
MTVNRSTRTRKKILFILYNYKELNDLKANGGNPLVFLAAKWNNFENIGSVDVAKGIKIVDELLIYYRIQNRGVDKFIELSFFQHHKRVYVSERLHISESTAGNWRREVIDRAELIAAMLEFN